MRLNSNGWIRLLLLFLITGSRIYAQDPNYIHHFDYDKSASLELKTIGTETRGNVTVYDITYASPKGGVVPAYLVVPNGKG